MKLKPGDIAYHKNFPNKMFLITEDMGYRLLRNIMVPDYISYPQQYKDTKSYLQIHQSDIRVVINIGEIYDLILKGE